VDVEHSSQSYKGEVCLIQISSTKDFIVDALALKDHIQTLKPVFEAESIVKVLHGAYNDVKWLYENFGFKILSLYDTQEAHKLFGHKDLGLDKLWSKYCEHSMDRSHKKEMQSSDWTLRPLSSIQLNYAATDSHFLLYLRQVTWNQLDELQRVKLLEKCQEISNSWALTDSKRKLKKYETGMDSGTFLVLKELLELREGIAKAEDVNPRSLVTTKTLAELASTNPTSLEAYDFPLILTHSESILKILKKGKPNKSGLKDHLTRKDYKKRRFEQFVEKYSVKKNVYENCKILGPDSEFLSYSNSRNAMWYVKKGLGEVVTEAPLVVKLKFVPSGRPDSEEDPYNQKELHNHCVVCGATGTYLKYHIIPLLYRQFIPLEMRKYKSRDLVLLCPKCHEKASASGDKLIRTLSEEYNVPLVTYSPLFTTKLELDQISRRATSLLASWSIMPEDRRQFFIDELKDYFGKNSQFQAVIAEKFGSEWYEDVRAVEFIAKNSKVLLETLGKINWKKESVNLHGKYVVDLVQDCEEFTRRWRRYFVSELEPKFLSDAWYIGLEA